MTKLSAFRLPTYGATTVQIDTPGAVREFEVGGTNAKLAEAIVFTISRAHAETATKSHVEAVGNEAIVQITLAQLLIAGVGVAFPKLTT